MGVSLTSTEDVPWTRRTIRLDACESEDDISPLDSERPRDAVGDLQTT